MASKTTGLSVLIIGAGVMGFNHARALSENARVARVIVADPLAATLERVKTIGSDKISTTADVDVAIQAGGYDCAVVAAPTHLHVPLATKLLEKGIPTLVEKPISFELPEARALAALAHKKKTLLLIGHIERFNPAVQTLKKHISTIGPIVYASAHRFGVPTTRDVGDVMLDVGVHDIDVLSFLSGEAPQRVSAMGAQVIDSKSPDLHSAIMDYGSFTATIECNRVTPIKERRLTVLGTQGAAILDYITQDLVIYKSDKADTKYSSFDEIVMRVGRGTEIRPYFTKQEPLKVEHDHFLDCVQGKTKPILTPTDAIIAVIAAQTSLKAAKTGAREKIQTA